MVITVLEAAVAPDARTTLVAAFESAIQALDPGIVETFLAESTKDAGRWQIVTVWSDRNALDAMRASGETPRGVLIFREAGADPTLSVFDVAAHAVA